MTLTRVDGLAAALADFDRIPEAAREQLAVELGLIGREVLQLQRATVAKDTGALAGALSLAVQVDRLRARIGLIGNAVTSRSALRKQRRTGRELRNVGGFFYGIIVEVGRKAQTVIVERRARTRAGRRGRAEQVASTYALRVKAAAPRPYIRTADAPAVQSVVASRLANFWSETLAKAGAT